MAPAQSGIADLTKPERNPSQRSRRSGSAAQRMRVQDWVLSPEGNHGRSGGRGAGHGSGAAGALDGSEGAKAEAGELFRAVIEPIINPERYADLHQNIPEGDLWSTLPSSTEKQADALPALDAIRKTELRA